MVDTKAFFVTDQMSWETWGLKGKSQQHYVTGYISTDEVDIYNEVVTPAAMKSMITQLKSGNIKLDVEHETFKGASDIPIGRIVDAKMVEEKGVHKIWIKATINKSHSKFGEVWKSIRDGFLDAFSIAYKATEVADEIMDGASIRMLKAIDLLNVALTGNPVNRGSRMVDSFMKSVQEHDFEAEDEKMSEEKIEEPKEEVKEEVKEEPKEESKEEVKEEPKEEKNDAFEDLKNEVAGIKEQMSTVQEAVDNMNGPLDSIKSLKGEIAELKSQMKKPQMKSVMESPREEVKLIHNGPLDIL